ncbi:MAG: SpoIID/LytB domain-containing protein [Candidatus Omnitrophota bacterium]
MPSLSSEKSAPAGAINNFLKLSLPLFFLIFLGGQGCLADEQASKPEPILIRVAVVKDARFARIFIPGEFKITDLMMNKALFQESYLPSVNLTLCDKGFKLGDIPIDAEAITIEQIGGTRIHINDRVYRGQIKALKNGKGLMIVNTVDLEEYLYGVIRNEISTWWPMEAVKAQVIAARTYALYQIKESKNKDYDVTADVSSQVYGGVFSEKWRTNRAVDLTAGKALTYKGAIFPAYFHATCGGATTDAALLWNINLPPLKGVNCGWCGKSPHFYWEKRMTLEEARLRLERSGYFVGGICGFEVATRDSSGRVISVAVKGEGGVVEIPGKDFRLIIGVDILRSTNFRIIIEGDCVVFNGVGWGHGVGMCQWGAYYMSRAGKKTDEILSFYYPGAVVMDYKNVK